MSHKNSMFNPDQSAVILTVQLEKQCPFIYVRFGDGALECINGKIGRTCDGEIYSDALGLELTRVWNLLFKKRNVYIGDWFSASFNSKSPNGLYEFEYNRLVKSALTQKDARQPHWLHFEALLFMRTTPLLLNFYKAIRNDNRKKLLMGPKEWYPASKILKTDFLEIPVSPTLFYNHLEELKQELALRDFDVLLYGAGMAGNIPVIDHWNAMPEKTYINLGSALDPMYRGRTRQQQIASENAVKYFQGVCQ